MTKLTQKAVIALIREMGLTCSRTVHGEYRINLPKGSEATAVYTADGQDAIATARTMTEGLATPKRWKQAFRIYLLSAKFQGTERCCAKCHVVPAWSTDTLCNVCGGPITEVRKDWIATADVLSWLDDLGELL